MPVRSRRDYAHASRNAAHADGGGVRGPPHRLPVHLPQSPAMVPRHRAVGLSMAVRNAISGLVPEIGLRMMSMTGPTFDTEWRARFERYGQRFEDEAFVSGWSKTGLERRLRLFESLLPELRLSTPADVLDLGCGA